MIRLLGCLMIAGGAAFLGFSAAGRLRGQMRALDELAAALRLLEQELEYSAPGLEELSFRLARMARGAGGELFRRFGQMLGELGKYTAAEIWERAVSGLARLDPETKYALLSLGDVLGRYDCTQQRITVAAVRVRLERLRELREPTCRMRCRTFQTIGLSGGAFLVILLL